MCWMLRAIVTRARARARAISCRRGSLVSRGSSSCSGSIATMLCGSRTGRVRSKIQRMGRGRRGRLWRGRWVCVVTRYWCWAAIEGEGYIRHQMVRMLLLLLSEGGRVGLWNGIAGLPRSIRSLSLACLIRHGNCVSRSHKGLDPLKST